MTLPFSGALMFRGPSIALAADFGMGASYSSTEAAANTVLVLTVKRDGTWTITVGAGDVLAGTPTSGTWAASTETSIGDQYEVQFSTANSVGSPTITNGASSYTAITGDKTIQVAKAAANASADVTVAIRPIGGAGGSLTDTANFAANGA